MAINLQTLPNNNPSNHRFVGNLLIVWTVIFEYYPESPNLGDLRNTKIRQF